MKGLGNHVAVIGLGVSGVQTALYLKQRGFNVFVSEMRQDSETEEQARLLSVQSIQTEIGSHSFEKILACDWAVISPGISPKTAIHQALVKAEKPIFSEIEVASWFCPSKKIIAVTGTAGKTTMATLITQWLEENHEPVISCGNIGNPWIGELERLTPDHFVVIEVSSFQLFHCKEFHPWVAILLNLSPNHLDWHETMEHYSASKANIFSRQNSNDLAILSSSDQKNFFSSRSFASQVAFYDQVPGSSAVEKILKILSRFFTFPEASVQKTLTEFKGIEHRLEHVDVCRGVTFINDSKCTTPLSLHFALERYPDDKVILLAGGRAKSKDFEDLKPIVRKKVKKALIYGESAQMINASWKEACTTETFKDLEDAFKKATAIAVEGDVVLLSPACASFDQFKNYQERGNFFKQKVLSLINHNVSHTQKP